ncbi:MAG: hypothetical protein AABW80_05200 [Nanoarchaeota archaeon]
MANTCKLEISGATEAVKVSAGYDIMGNVAIVKYGKDVKRGEKRKFAEGILKTNKSVKTVLEKVGKFSGRLRTNKTKYILGENTKEVLYRENGCEFRFNVDTCYFSSRLSEERKEISKMCKKGENILVMFGGVGVYAIVIGKNSKVGRVISVELNRIASKYAIDNVKRNKLVGKVEIVQGDVRRVIGKGKEINEKYDRIVMARPNLKDDFLDVAFSAIKKNGIIQYYGFYDEVEVIAHALEELIEKRAKEARKRIKIVRIKKAGDIGVRKFRYRMDVKVLN